MIMLEWSDDKMSLGIKLIDEQHKELLNIINMLANSIDNYSQREDILTIVNKLIDYSYYHFSMEEELFAQFNYKDVDAHKKEHLKFTKIFSELKLKLTNDEYFKDKSAINIAEEIFEYITSWLIHHIINSDKKYVELFKEKGIE